MLSPSEAHSKLVVVITDEVLRPHTIVGGFPKLLCGPSVGGRSCDADMDHFAECNLMMKKAESDRKSKSVTGRKSQAQICSA